MSDDEQAGPSGSEQATGGDRRFRIQKLYLKDVSFESPATPGIFSADSDLQPSINFQLDTEQSQVGDTLYEVVLGVTVTATHGERTVFLVELKQAGLFEASGFEEADFYHMLGSYCPAILYPYARAAVADLVQKGGLPQVILQPINFDALFAQEHARKQQAAEAETQGDGAAH